MAMPGVSGAMPPVSSPGGVPSAGLRPSQGGLLREGGNAANLRIQRCGIGSSCDCPPRDKLAGIEDDLQRATAVGGTPLPATSRERMENAFSSDFAAVRVHTGTAAHDAASALAARALTAGTDILFRAGEYQPGTPGGDRLLAHELAHVVQQAHGLPQGIPGTGATGQLEKAAGLAADQASPAAEREARGAAMIAAMGGPVPALSRQPPAIARQDDLEELGTSPPDAGTSPPDAGTSPPDAGTSPLDAGTSPPDAGTSPPDAGTSPAPAAPAPGGLAGLTATRDAFNNSGAPDPNDCAALKPAALGVDGPAVGQNGMEMIFRIHGPIPPGTEFDITRTKATGVWQEDGGVWSRLGGWPAGTSDDHTDDDECLTPAARRIFVVDTPGPPGTLDPTTVAFPNAAAVSATVTALVWKLSFAEWVIARNRPLGIGWMAISTPLFHRWHSIFSVGLIGGAWTHVDTPGGQHNEIELGAIAIDGAAP
jgi:hypothetical protein